MDRIELENRRQHYLSQISQSMTRLASLRRYERRHLHELVTLERPRRLDIVYVDSYLTELTDSVVRLVSLYFRMRLRSKQQ